METNGRELMKWGSLEEEEDDREEEEEEWEEAPLINIQPESLLT